MRYDVFDFSEFDLKTKTVGEPVRFAFRNVNVCFEYVRWSEVAKEYELNGSVMLGEISTQIQERDLYWMRVNMTDRGGFEHDRNGFAFLENGKLHCLTVGAQASDIHRMVQNESTIKNMLDGGMSVPDVFTLVSI